MKKIVFYLLVAVSLLFISANTRDSSNKHEYVTIDTAPGADGYWTNPTIPGQNNKKGKTYFSVRGSTWVATVTLQFRCQGDTEWTDYPTTYTENTRQIIDDEAQNVQWRAGIKNGEFTSGEVTLGIDW